MFFQKDEERIRRRAQRTTSTEPAPGAQRPLPVLRQGPRCRNARPERNTGGGSAQRTNAAARPATRSFGQRPEPSTAVAAGQVLERSSAAPMPDRDLPVEHELAAAILRAGRAGSVVRASTSRGSPTSAGEVPGAVAHDSALDVPGRQHVRLLGGGSASDRRTRARSSPSSGFPVMTRPSTRCWRTTPRRPTGRVPRCGPDRCRRSGPVPAARVALGRLAHVDVGAWHHVPVAVRGAVPPAAEERGVAPPRARCPPDCPSGSSRGRRGSPRRTPGCHRRWRARAGTRRTAPAPVVGPLGRNPGPQWSWSDRGRARSDVVPRTCFSRTRRSTRPQGGGSTERPGGRGLANSTGRPVQRADRSSPTCCCGRSDLRDGFTPVAQLTGVPSMRSSPCLS